MKWLLTAISLLIGVWGIAHAQTGTGDNSNKTYAVPALSPATIFQGDLMVWYKCDVGITTSGSGVTAWADQSGNGRNLSAISGNFAFSNTSLNNHCGLTSTDTGSNFLLATSAFDINSIKNSLFFVGIVSGCGSGTSLLGYTNGTGTGGGTFQDAAGFWLKGENGGNIPTWHQANFAGNAFFPVLISFSTAYRMGFVNNGSTVTSFLNNVVQNNGGATSSGGDIPASGYNILGGANRKFQIGGLANGDFPCGFTISEALMTRSIATTAQRISLDNYFRTKWGL